MSAQSSFSNEPLSPCRVQYFITADVDPGVISRVTEPFALRGIVPDLVRVSRYQKTSLIRETLSIDIHVSGLCQNEQDVILQKLQCLVSIQNVRKEAIFKLKKAS